MANQNHPATQHSTYTQLAALVREDIKSLILRAWNGEEIEFTLRVWRDGEVVNLVLMGQELIERMRKMENDLVWEDARRSCATQPAHHPVQQALTAVIAMA